MHPHFESLSFCPLLLASLAHYIFFLAFCTLFILLRNIKLKCTFYWLFTCVKVHFVGSLDPQLRGTLSHESVPLILSPQLCGAEFGQCDARDAFFVCSSYSSKIVSSLLSGLNLELFANVERHQMQLLLEALKKLSR